MRLQRPSGGAPSSPLATASAAVDTSSKADSLLATSASGDRPETTSGYRPECRDLDSSLDSKDYVTLTSSSSQQHQQQRTTSGTPIVFQLSQACAAELHATPPELIRSRFLPPSAPFATQLAPPHPLSAPANLTAFVVPQEVFAIGSGNGTTGLLTPVRFLTTSGNLSQTNLVYNQPAAQHALFVQEPASRAFPVNHQPVAFQATEQHRHSGDYHYLGLCGVRDRLEHYQNSIGKAGSTGCLPDTSVLPEMQPHSVICRELSELRERLRLFENRMAARDGSPLEVAVRETSPVGVVRTGDQSELTPNFSTTATYTCASRIDLTSTQYV